MASRILDHSSVRIRDVEQSRRFYEGVLGLEPATRPELGIPGVWYALGHGQLHLIQNEGRMTRGIDPTNPHFAIEVDDLDALRSRLKAAGIEVLDFGEQLWVMDPDGNTVELRASSGAL